MFRVLLHNDDQTHAAFVVLVLMQIFRLEQGRAIEVMAEAHEKGVALVVVLPQEQAEFRIEQAHAIARTNKFPLTFTMEPE
jgi:ATP-dependent Clp protease adaptor protein ClpS